MKPAWEQGLITIVLSHNWQLKQAT